MTETTISPDQWKALIEASMLPRPSARRFTDAQWRTLVEAPLLVAAGVMAAGRRGAIPLYREWTAFVHALRSTETIAPDNRLVRDVTAAIRTLFEGARPAPHRSVDISVDMDAPAVRAQAVEACREVAAVLATIPAEAEGYARWLLAIASQVADTAERPTLLGRRDARVHEAEAALLRAFGEALGLPAGG